MRGVIYKYTSPSGKCYIWQTSQEEKRKYRFLNLKQFYGSAKIDNARRKYLPENFKYEILYEYQADNLQELRDILGKKEIEFITKYNSINEGYNHQEGGVYKTNIISKEARRRGDLKKSKIILQYDLGGQFIKEWLSTMDIERELGISHALISKNCLGETAHCREYLFRHKIGEEIPLKIEVSKNVKINKTKSISICQINLNGEEIKRWKSITSASKELGINNKKLKLLAEKEEIHNDFIYKLIK